MSDTLVDLTVQEIAAGGDGLARLETGRVVFVPRTAPGDRVLARLTENRARWSRGRVVAWKVEGPERVKPVCAHYDACGGCAIQHLGALAQVAALRRAVEDALGRIGRARVAVGPLEPAAERFGYRNRVTFTLRRLRGGVTAGYHRLHGPHLVDVLDCPLAEPAIREAWTSLREGWGGAAAALPAGTGLRITLRASSRGRTALLVAGGSTPGDPERVLEAVPSLESYWWKPARRDRLRLGGSDHFRDEWEGVEVLLRPEAFVQVNRRVAGRIATHLTEGLGPLAGLSVWDLYAGVGLRALAWARAGACVTLDEAQADAVETARDLARRDGVSLDIRHGRVEAVLSDLPPADVVVVNPPRKGLDPTVADRLAATDARRLIYVSCDPATLARDLARLSTGWRPTLAQPFDAFPQTGHVETVLWLERGAP